MAEIDRNDRRVIFPLSPSIATNDGGNDDHDDEDFDEDDDDDDEDDDMKSIMMRNMMMLMKMGKEAMANTSRDITRIFVIGTVQEA